MHNYDTKILPWGGENVFGFDDPEAYTCHVHHYTTSHRHLLMGLNHRVTHEMKFLDFGSVDYIEAPISWIGANCYTASLDELSKLYFHIRTPNADIEAYPGPYEILAETGLRLYVVHFAELRVRILASGVTLLDYDEFRKIAEGNYQWLTSEIKGSDADS